MEAAALGLLRLEEAALGDCRAVVHCIRVIEEPAFASPLQVRTLSPVSASTGRKEGDRFYKVFLSPEEPDFARVLGENLRRKYLALYGREPEGGIRFSFLPPWRSRLLNIAGTEIRGWEMELIIEGAPELLRLAYQWGLGEHNGSGFGMLGIRSGPFPKKSGVSVVEDTGAWPFIGADKRS